MNHKEIYKKALDKYGALNQLVVAIEELSELQKALCKILRHGATNNEGRINNAIEECADVEIMLGQVKQMLNIENRVNGAIASKLERLKQRIDSNT